jgi:hypothetical protein
MEERRQGERGEMRERGGEPKGRGQERRRSLRVGGVITVV